MEVYVHIQAYFQRTAWQGLLWFPTFCKQGLSRFAHTCFFKKNRCIDITFETSFTFTFCSAHVRCIYASQRFLPGQCQSYGAAYLADHVTKIFTSRCLEIGTSGNVFHKTCHLNYQKCLGFHSSIVLIIEGSLNSKLPTIWRVEKQ